MTKITLKGLNARGRNRVAEHGPIFERVDAPAHIAQGALLVRCRKPGCRCQRDRWMGWFVLGLEVEVV